MNLGDVLAIGIQLQRNATRTDKHGRVVLVKSDASVLYWVYSGVHCHVIQDTARSCIAGHPVFQTTTGGTAIKLQSGLHIYFFARRFTKFCGKRTKFRDYLLINPWQKSQVYFKNFRQKNMKYFLLTGWPVNMAVVPCPVQFTRVK